MGLRKKRTWVKTIQSGWMSLMYMKIIERMYDNPNINTSNKKRTRGSKTIVMPGIKSKKSINPKKTATSTNSKIAVVIVADTGKNSLLIL